MKSFISFFLCLTAAMGWSLPIQGHHAAVARLRVAGGGGGSAAWVDSMVTAGTTAYPYPEYPMLMPVTADQSGNVTKVRLWVSDWTATVNVKVGLYDNGRNLLQQATHSLTASGWMEVTITSTAVVSGTQYRVGAVMATAGNANFGHTSGHASGSSDLNFSSNYAGSMENPFTTSANTVKYPVGLYITP